MSGADRIKAAYAEVAQPLRRPPGQDQPFWHYPGWSSWLRDAPRSARQPPL